MGAHRGELNGDKPEINRGGANLFLIDSFPHQSLQPFGAEAALRDHVPGREPQEVKRILKLPHLLKAPAVAVWEDLLIFDGAPQAVGAVKILRRHQRAVQCTD